MATFWVNNVIGNNTWDGLSATDQTGTIPLRGPKLSVDGATGGLSLLDTAGDILNIINTGTTYDIATTTNLGGGTGSPLAGTSFTNFGAKVQGTNSAGVPTLVKLRHTAAASMIGVREGQNYIIVQSLECDRTVTTVGGTTSALNFVNINDSGAGIAGPVRVTRCIDRSNSTKSGRMVNDASGSLTATGAIEISYCYIRDPGTNGGLNIAGASHKQVLFHNNVLWLNSAGTTPAFIGLGTNDANAGVDHEVYHNTIYVETGSFDFINSSCTLATGANAAAQKRVHSNLVTMFSAGTSNRFMTGSATWSGTTWTGVREIVNNVFMKTGGITWTANGPYFLPWDVNNTESALYWPTDVVDTASTDPYHDRLTAWDWIVNDITITLPGDLRLDDHREDGKDGSVPGAIDEGFHVPSDPPDPDPGPSGLPVGPNAPAFLFDAPDGVLAALKLRRNTYLSADERFAGSVEAITHAGFAAVELLTNTSNQSLPRLDGARAIMLETDGEVRVIINGMTVDLEPRGCILIDGADLNTFRASNFSTVKSVLLRMFEGY